MATVASPAESRVLLYDISWQTYESMLADIRNGGVRLTYDRGYLEIMSPSQQHERLKRLIGRMIESMTEELEIPIRSAGSTTLKQELLDKGLESDECYYVSNEAKIRGRDEIDLSVDPPPDLAIEVDVTNRSLDRMEIYAAIRVPEVWRYDTQRLRVYHLQPDGTYEQRDESRAFPFLPLDAIERFLDQRNSTDETSWIRSFRAWVRSALGDSPTNGAEANE